LKLSFKFVCIFITSLTFFLHQPLEDFQFLYFLSLYFISVNVFV
jgi:hypothetical protein